VGSLDRPSRYYQNSSPQALEGLVEGSFIGEDDKRINELLNYRVRLPEKIRIAILKLSNDNYWRFYSSDFTQLSDSLVSELILSLRNSNRVYDASFLPAMLVPEKRTIPILREAAARFQSDLLLAYRSYCQSYQNYRLIEANENRSYCGVEAVLLDVRSGIIVKSIVSTEVFTTKKMPSDTNFSETVKKAEIEATAKALGNVAKQVVLFLDTVPLIENL
jgi:hypothetical protein